MAIDYAAANVQFRKQKSALTRAVNADRKNPTITSRANLLEVVTKAVTEWESPPFNGAWPDDWSRWQRALDDAYDFGSAPTLDYIARGI